VGADEPALSASLKWLAPAASPDPRPCERAGTQLVRVRLEQVFAGRPPLDAALEVLIGLEPPVTGDTGPAGDKDRAAFTTPTGAAVPVVGGGSFNTAATLPGSGSYTDAVFSGELVFYRIRLDWGRGLAYRVRFHGRGYVATHWYSPARQRLASDVAAGGDREVTLDGSADALGGPPVRYRNRELTSPQAEVSVAGWYYIAVMVELLPDPTPLTVTVDVSVTGQTQSGPAFGADAGKDPFGDQSGGSARTAGAAGDDSGVFATVANAAPLLWVGASLVALVLLAGGVGGMLAVRRRRSRVEGPAG
jgi:Ca-activated chloride channel family protein